MAKTPMSDSLRDSSLHRRYSRKTKLTAGIPADKAGFDPVDNGSTPLSAARDHRDLKYHALFKKWDLINWLETPCMPENIDLPEGGMFGLLLDGHQHPAQPHVGKKIVDAELTDERLTLTFEDGAKIYISDAGQSCCESRYITTDDDIRDLIGKPLVYVDYKVSAEEPPPDARTDDYHEIAFVEVGTDDGSVMLCTHNEHNGYYGGFRMVLRYTNNGNVA